MLSDTKFRVIIEEDDELLKKLGCDVIQGYYFSKPVCAAEFERFITG